MFPTYRFLVTLCTGGSCITIHTTLIWIKIGTSPTISLLFTSFCLILLQFLSPSYLPPFSFFPPLPVSYNSIILFDCILHQICLHIWIFKDWKNQLTNWIKEDLECTTIYIYYKKNFPYKQLYTIIVWRLSYVHLSIFILSR